MAKSILLDVLDKTIGQYVVNLDVNAVNVSIWKGHVELQSLKLDVDAVNGELASFKPPLPFRVKSGSFDSFQVNVPWRNLMNIPVSFKANGLSIQLEPQLLTEHEFAADPRSMSREDAIKARRKAIDQAEMKRSQLNAFRVFLQETEQAEEGKTSRKADQQKSSSMGTKLLRRILENLEISISNIHLSVANEQVDAGIALRSCKVFKVSKPESSSETETASSSGSPSFLEKCFSVEGLSIYINEQPSSNSHQVPLHFDYSEWVQKQHSFILRPLSINAKFQKSDDPFCLENPRYSCLAEVKSMQLILSKEQIELSKILLASAQSPSSTKESDKTQAILFPQYRPYRRLGENDPKAAMEWWRYVFRCVRRLRRKHLLDEVLELYHHRQRYIKLYQRRIYAPTTQTTKSDASQIGKWVVPLSDDEMFLLDTIEDDRFIPVNTLMKWRDIAEARMMKETEKVQSHYLRPSEIQSILLNKDEVRALEFQFWRVEEEVDRLSAESKLYKITFSLVSLQICIKEESSLSMIATHQIDHITTAMETSVSGAFLLALTVKAVSFDYHAQNAQFPKILDSNSYKPDEDALSISFENSESKGQHLSARIKSFDIFIVPDFLKDIYSLLTFHDEDDANRASSRETFRQDKQVTRKSVLMALVAEWRIRERALQKWILDIDISKVTFILVPDATDVVSKLFVAEFACLQASYTQGRIVEDGPQRWLIENPRPHKAGKDSILGQALFQIESLSVRLLQTEQWMNGIRGTGKHLLSPVHAQILLGVELSSAGTRISSNVSISSFLLAASHENVKDLVTTIASINGTFRSERRRSQRNEKQSSSILPEVGPVSTEVTKLHRVSIEIAQRNEKQSSSILPEVGPVSTEVTKLHRVSIEIDRISLLILGASGKGVEIHLTRSVATVESLSSKTLSGSMKLGSLLVEHVHDSLRQYILRSSHSSKGNSLDKPVSDQDSSSFGRSDSVAINYEFTPATQSGKYDPFQRDALYSEDVKCSKSINIEVSALYLFWNPLHAIDVKENISGLLRLIRTHQHVQSRTVQKTAKTKSTNDSQIVLRVSVTSCSLWLITPVDDKPLFHLKIPFLRTYCSVKLGAFFLNIDLDKVELETPVLGSTHPKNRVLIGPSHEKASQRVLVQVALGKDAINLVQSGKFESEDCHLVVLVSLSTGFIGHYVHSHIMGFVSYLKSSILGVILPPPTLKPSKAPLRKKLIVVRTSAFDVKVPEKASDGKCIALEFDSVEVKIYLKPPTHRTISVQLSGTKMSDSKGISMLEKRIDSIFCVISVPPRNPAVVEQGEILISTNVAAISFAIVKEQYDSLMLLMKGNIREPSLSLRAEDESNDILPKPPFQSVFSKWPKRSVTVKTAIDKISLSLFHKSDGKLVIVGASMYFLELYLIRQEQTLKASMGLENFICLDHRSIHGDYAQQQLVRSSRTIPTGASMQLSIESNKGMKTSTKLTLDSVEVVFVPDIFADIAAFFKLQNQDLYERSTRESRTSNGKELAVPAASEVAFHLDAPALSVVFVDLGSINQQTEQSTTMDKIVLGTNVKASYVSKASIRADPSTIQLGVDANGFGFHSVIESTLLSSHVYHVVEPFDFAVRYQSENWDALERRGDFKLAMESKVRINVSLRQYGLAETILTSIADHFGDDTTKKRSSIPMTNSDARRIQRLDAALKSIDDTSIETFRNSLVSEEIHGIEGIENKNIPCWTINASMSLNKVELLLTNDLNGLKDPLLRLAIIDTVGSIRLEQGRPLLSGTQKCTFFDSDLIISVMAEYFEPSDSSWQRLLHPWEIMIAVGRNQSEVPNRAKVSADIQAFPCTIDFSDSLLLRLNEAKAMWKAYADAKSKLIHSMEDPGRPDAKRAALSKISRALLHNRAYVFENQSGFDVEFECTGTFRKRAQCSDGTSLSFELEVPRAPRSSSKRSDDDPGKQHNDVLIHLQGETIVLSDFDQAPSGQKNVHQVNSIVLFSHVCRRKNSMSIRLSGGFEIFNNTRLSLAVGVRTNNTEKDAIFVMSPIESANDEPSLFSSPRSLVPSISLPAKGMSYIQKEWANPTKTSMHILIRVIAQGLPYEATITFDLNEKRFHGKSSTLIWRGEIVCCTTTEASMTEEEKISGACVFRGKITGSLLAEKYIAFEMFLEPRAKLKSNLQIPVTVRSSASHLYSPVTLLPDGGVSIHQLDTEQVMHIYSSSSEICFSAKPTGNPRHGTQYDWTCDISIPLCGPGFQKPQRYHFPPCTVEGVNDSHLDGAELFLSSGMPTSFGWTQYGKLGRDTRDYSKADEGDELVYFLSICTYFIDHTREAVVSRVAQSQAPTVFTTPSPAKGPPFLHGAYASTLHSWLISPLSTTVQKFQFISCGRKCKPFSIDEVSVCEGGAGSTPVKWEDGRQSHLFMYRRIPDPFQCEIHLVPSHVIFNCSQHNNIRVHEDSGQTLDLKPQTFTKLNASADNGVAIKVECQELGVTSSSIEVGRLGTRIAVVWTAEGVPTGSVTVESSLGSIDSHMVIKIGQIQLGSHANDIFEKANSFGAIEEDILGGRIILSQFTVSMSRSRMQPLHASTSLLKSDIDLYRETVCTSQLKKIVFEGVKVFQIDQAKSQSSGSQLRNSFSLSVGSVEILDNRPESKMPVVLQSSPSAQFIHATVDGRSALYQTLVDLDHLDVRISEREGKPEALILSVNESFAWSLLHLVDQMKAASSEYSAIELELVEHDDDDGKYKVSIQRSKFFQPTKYPDPECSAFFNIDVATVSAFAVLLTLETSPEELRKQRARISGPLATPLTFFAERMKFKIDKADLSFSRFQASDIRGPLGKMVSMLSTFYIGQLKYQVFTLMAAMSLPEWEFHYTKEAISEVEKVLQLDFQRTAGHKLIFGRDERPAAKAKAKAEAVVQELAHFIPGLDEATIELERPRPVRHIVSQAKKGIDLICQLGFKKD